MNSMVTVRAVGPSILGFVRLDRSAWILRELKHNLGDLVTLHEVLIYVFGVCCSTWPPELIWLDIWRMAKATTTCIRKPFIEIFFVRFGGQSVEKQKLLFILLRLLKCYSILHVQLQVWKIDQLDRWIMKQIPSPS